MHVVSVRALSAATLRLCCGGCSGCASVAMAVGPGD